MSSRLLLLDAIHFVIAANPWRLRSLFWGPLLKCASWKWAGSSPRYFLNNLRICSMSSSLSLVFGVGKIIISAFNFTISHVTLSSAFISITEIPVCLNLTVSLTRIDLVYLERLWNFYSYVEKAQRRILLWHRIPMIACSALVRGL